MGVVDWAVVLPDFQTLMVPSCEDYLQAVHSAGNKLTQMKHMLIAYAPVYQVLVLMGAVVHFVWL